MKNSLVTERFKQYWANFNEPKDFNKLTSQIKRTLYVIKRESIISVYRIIRPKPDFITLKKWDNLIILDACRFDVFSYVNTIPGILTKNISAGSNTPEWLRNNFTNKNMKDTVYISANPYGSFIYLKKMLGNNPFFNIREVWKDMWDEELGTVTPTKVNEAVIQSLDEYPSKRHIIHYMQPHYPFIRKKSLIWEGMTDIRDEILYNKDWEGKNIWTLLREGKVNADVVFQAYINNLIDVLGCVEKILKSLPGQVCITSDHGNMFGKYGIFCHGPQMPLPELIEVPWLEVA